MSWTNPAHVEKLRELWPTGSSCSQIAAAINGAYPDACYSRSAIIGKANRLGLADKTRQRPTDPGSARAARRAAPKAPAKPRLIIAGKNQVRVAKETQPPRVEIKVAAFEPIPGSTPRPWMERTLAMCCWPVGGEGESTLYCCEPVHKRGWCAHHFGRGTVPLPAKKPTTGSDLYRSLRRYVA